MGLKAKVRIFSPSFFGVLDRRCQFPAWLRSKAGSLGNPCGRTFPGFEFLLSSTSELKNSITTGVSPNELHRFYEELVCQLRDRGVVCAITSGLACVHYGIAETTQDCDLLCHPRSFDSLLEVLNETRLQEQPCQYRGNISPPLDARWHLGGWTSHFEWNTQGQATTLDVFGRAVRQSSPWELDLAGLYAGRNVVAEMKRTDRDKDWPFITSLGTDLLRSNDPRGWLHLFDADALVELQDEYQIPLELTVSRPVLELAVKRDPGLRQALFAERVFWQELDRLRIRLYRAALRPYVLAVGREGLTRLPSLRDQHAARVACAANNLAQNPMAAYGVERLIEAARSNTAALVRPELLRWLPNVSPYFTYLEA
jgi:hypothetical protein